MEGSFSMDRGGWGDGLGMIQVHYIQAHLLLCSPVPNRPRPLLVHGLEIGYPCFNFKRSIWKSVFNLYKMISKIYNAKVFEKQLNLLLYATTITTAVSSTITSQ